MGKEVACLYRFVIHSFAFQILLLLSFRGLAYSENLTDDDEAECESVLGLVPHQVNNLSSVINVVLHYCNITRLIIIIV